jgi:uncharacterized repeat protein (TIGR01451 family)
MEYAILRVTTTANLCIRLRFHSIQSYLYVFILLLFNLTCAVHAQTIWASGDATGGTTFNKLYSVNATTGLATRVCPTTTFDFNSTAIGVSNLQNGLIFYIERIAAVNPRINSFDPTTCINGTPVATTLPADILRATACPDGRFYAMTNTTVFYEINTVTGETIRTLNLSGLPTGSSGDFSCVTNGDMYILSDAGANGVYELYRMPSASFQTIATGSTAIVGVIGTNLGLTGPTNGLTEAPTGTVGCAASPNPCLVASTGATNRTWGMNSVLGTATNIGTTTAVLVDLSRNFAIQPSINKTVTPTNALQGQTVTYTLLVGNPGSSVIGRATITDVLSSAFGTATWACNVVNPGSTVTLVTTGCGIASGSGSVNNTVSLSIGGTVQFVITATLNSNFTGTVTNAAGITTSVNYAVNPSSINNATVTSTVSPAASLSVTKTNGTTTVVAGSTTTYTVTFVNSGPGAANNAVAKDFSSAGLSACVVSSCAGAGSPTAASCPASPSDLLTSAGVALPVFPASSSITFLVRCEVTAIGS